MGAEAGRQFKRLTRPLIGHKSVLGVQTFTYLAGLQLLLVGGRSTLLAGAVGITAGCLYKVNFLGLKKLRVCGNNALCSLCRGALVPPTEGSCGLVRLP